MQVFVAPETCSSRSQSRTLHGHLAAVVIGHEIRNKGVESGGKQLPESSTWHDGTFTRWIAALSAAAAPRTPDMGISPH